MNFEDQTPKTWLEFCHIHFIGIAVTIGVIVLFMAMSIHN